MPLNMPKLSPLVLALSLTLVGAGAATAQSAALQGDWRSEGGGLRVAGCGNGAAQCVTVTYGSQTAESMSDIVGQTVVRNLLPVRGGVWRGRYVADGKNLPADVTLHDPRSATFKVCLVSWISFSCQSQAIVRTGPGS